ncbi:succinylglutamate desuccinylase/aspartoacylase family protein [Proteus mirabilis]|uniref:M14 family zinc carboxypeptidase n=1 Tax=Proteus mirabilis TaxID=584 RepID=UPI002024DF06|nr:M14 family zinc carboxypeptidase [Proteus mirabilis]MCL8607652.1 succinylglutamate desuccinylase/aspartoacylase family protein [Proteus mirabilis]
MSTIPTQNPVPSEAPRDLKFNSGKIDEFVTSMKNKYIDRFGKEHFTIEGLRWIAQQAISQFGYITLDSFQKGAEITLPNQVLRDETTGEYYRWDGELPKIVHIDSTPDNSGGVGMGSWVSVGEASLRSELNQTFKSAVGMGLIADGATNEKGTLDNIKLTASEDRTPVIVQTTGSVRSRMHNEPVDDLMPEQLVTLGNLKGRLDVYDPDPVPSWNEAVDGVVGGTTTINADWLYAEWDKLVRASKDNLIRQEDIGISQDGAYPIRHYIWLGANHSTSGAPDKNLKEILVTAGIHGSETVGMLGLLYFMKDLVEKGDEIPALRWLYYNTRIRIVPVANPWGVSQLPKVRNNSRGVNINRNFDYRWADVPQGSPGSAGYKGESPFSESETKALRSWFGKFASRAVAYVDIHSMGIYTGSSAKPPHFIGFCNSLSDPIANKIFTKFANKHTRIEVTNGQDSPMSRNYATVNFGLPSFTCEHTDTAWAREGASYSQAKDTSYSLTGAVKMYGNVIAGFAKLAVRQLFPVFIENNNAGIVVPRSDNWTQLFSRNSYDAGIDGIMTVKAGVVVKNNSEVDTVVSLAIIGESGVVSGYYPYATVSAGSSVSLNVEKSFRVDKSQRKYPISVHVLSRYSEATVIKYCASIEPKYLGYDVGNI